MTPESLKWILGALLGPIIVWMLSAIRKSLANFGQRLGTLERDVAVLLALRNDDRRVRHVTRAAPVTEDDDDAQ